MKLQPQVKCISKHSAAGQSTGFRDIPGFVSILSLTLGNDLGHLY